jgi:hypothetical protein
MTLASLQVGAVVGSGVASGEGDRAIGVDDGGPADGTAGGSATFVGACPQPARKRMPTTISVMPAELRRHTILTALTD